MSKFCEVVAGSDQNTFRKYPLAHHRGFSKLEQGVPKGSKWPKTGGKQAPGSKTSGREGGVRVAYVQARLLCHAQASISFNARAYKLGGRPDVSPNARCRYEEFFPRTQLLSRRCQRTPLRTTLDAKLAITASISLEHPASNSWTISFARLRAKKRGWAWGGETEIRPQSLPVYFFCCMYEYVMLVVDELHEIQRAKSYQVRHCRMNGFLDVVRYCCIPGTCQLFSTGRKAAVPQHSTTQHQQTSSTAAAAAATVHHISVRSTAFARDF